MNDFLAKTRKVNNSTMILMYPIQENVGNGNSEQTVVGFKVEKIVNGIIKKTVYCENKNSAITQFYKM